MDKFKEKTGKELKLKTINTNSLLTEKELNIIENLDYSLEIYTDWNNLVEQRKQICKENKYEFYDITSDGDYFEDGGLYEVDKNGKLKPIKLISRNNIIDKDDNYYNWSKKKRNNKPNYLPEKYPYNENIFNNMIEARKNAAIIFQNETILNEDNKKLVYSKSWSKNHVDGISKVCYIDRMKKYNLSIQDKDFSKYFMGFVILVLGFALFYNWIGK